MRVLRNGGLGDGCLDVDASTNFQRAEVQGASYLKVFLPDALVIRLDTLNVSRAWCIRYDPLEQQSLACTV